MAINLTPIPSLQNLSGEFGKAAEALRVWGAGEGDDLGVSESYTHPRYQEAHEHDM